ncbi:MAG: glycosyltransferase [Pedobacter sp.]|nr:MAG: glycosyltransferase [Pedobacter sp.]
MINLPDLKLYKQKLIAEGASFPLSIVPSRKDGLLKILPPPKNGREGWPWTIETSPLNYDININWPKVTIVTPSYNQGEFIEETIRAVLLQNYPNLEYIIVDGGSTDNTTEILKKYAPWFSYWKSERDGGQSNAINQGFSLGSGDYNAWINSDDYYMKDVFHLVVSTFLKSKVQFIYGYAINYDEPLKKHDIVAIPPFLDLFIRIPSLVQPSCFWASSIHQPLWEDLNCSLDYELWLRLVKGVKRKLLKTPLATARSHEDAKTFDPSMKKKWEEDHLLICSPEAHGSVPTWNYLIFMNRVYKKVLNLIKYQ